MYRIYHLERKDPFTFKLEGTDYDPMDLEQAESIVTELNRDAIQSSSPDRWTIMSQD